MRYAVGLCVAGYGALQVLGRQAGSTWQEGLTRLVTVVFLGDGGGNAGQVLEMNSATSPAPMARPDMSSAANGAGFTTNVADPAATSAPAAWASQYGPRSCLLSLPRR